MPTSLARLFGRSRHRKGADQGYALRVAAALAEAEDPLRALQAGCRLARRIAGCQVAVVGVWQQAPGPSPRAIEVVAGRWHRGEPRLLEEALAGRHSPAHMLGERPFWVRLADDPFQPGATLLRRFDLQWGLMLPLALLLDGLARRCVVFLAGDDADVEPHHPLVRDARLIWLAVRDRLASGPISTSAPVGSPWPAGDAWEHAPAALASVGTDAVLAINAAARALLVGSLGADRDVLDAWLVAARQRLEMAGCDREVVIASQRRASTLEVTLGPDEGPDQPRLLGLHPVAAEPAEAADLEATMRVLGHELRTPLAAIKTSLDLVQRADPGGLSPDQGRFLGIARRNVDRLNRLLGDLLDAKRAEAGSLSVRPETVDLGDVLTQDLDMLRIVGREKGIDLDTTGVPSAFRACVDADKVQQMLHNVVGNAIKYTGRGGLVRVRLVENLTEMPGEGARLARIFGLPLDVFGLVVEDSGMGMSEEFLQVLFQPFRRDDRAERGGVPGAGLGLHITRGLAEAHGGFIHLESRPGQGTTVWLVLPRAPESRRALVAGQQLDAARQRAVGLGLPVEVGWLDLRDKLADARQDALDLAMSAVSDFIAGLGRASRREDVRRFQQTAGPLCWTPASGLWCGLILDVARLQAAWQVAAAAPSASPMLAGSRWQLFAETPPSARRPDQQREVVPLG